MNAAIPDALKPFDFCEMTAACRATLTFAFNLRRKNRDLDIPWSGPNYEHANHFSPAHALTAESLRYADEEQGRDALTEIIAVILQLGIEQGRRIRRDSSFTPFLDEVYGAVFTVRVGYDDQTSVHTQAGLLAVPDDSLNKAIAALQYELTRTPHCPRAQAIEARGDETRQGLGLKGESAVGPEGTDAP